MQRLIATTSAAFFLTLYSSHLLAQAEVEWVHMYDTGNQVLENFYDIYDVTGDGYILCGEGNVHSWIVRIDDDSETFWSETYDGTLLHSIIETDEGNILSGGRLENLFSAILVDELTA